MKKSYIYLIIAPIFIILGLVLWLLIKDDGYIYAIILSLIGILILILAYINSKDLEEKKVVFKLDDTIKEMFFTNYSKVEFNNVKEYLNNFYVLEVNAYKLKIINENSVNKFINELANKGLLICFTNTNKDSFFALPFQNNKLELKKLEELPNYYLFGAENVSIINKIVKLNELFMTNIYYGEVNNKSYIYIPSTNLEVEKIVNDIEALFKND